MFMHVCVCMSRTDAEITGYGLETLASVMTAETSMCSYVCARVRVYTHTHTHTHTHTQTCHITKMYCIYST